MADERETWPQALVRALKIGDALRARTKSLRDRSAGGPISREALEIYLVELRRAEAGLLPLTQARSEAQWQAIATEIRNAPANPLSMWTRAHAIGGQIGDWVRDRFPQGPSGTADRAMAYLDPGTGDIRMAEWSVVETAPLRDLLDQLAVALTY